MTFAISQGIWISPDNNTWYKLTDDNRSAIVLSPQRIEQAQRMADGSMRKYVVATKNIISADWTHIPSASALTGSGYTGAFGPTTDGGKSAAFMKAFYNQYLYQPIYLRVINATDNSSATSPQSSQTGTGISPITISTVTPSSPSTGFVTYSTSLSHGLTAGDVVNIAGIYPIGYNGDYVVTNVGSATQFTVSNINTATASGTYKTVMPSKGVELYQVFMTNFEYIVKKRFTLLDYVDVKMEFTEI